MFLSQFSARLKPQSGDTTVIERVSGNTLTNTGTGTVTVVDRGAGDMCLRVVTGTMVYAIPTSADYIVAGQTSLNLNGGSGDAGATIVCRIKANVIDGANSTSQVLACAGADATVGTTLGAMRYGSAAQALARGNYIGSGSNDTSLTLGTERTMVIRMMPNKAANSSLDTLDVWITGGSGVGDLPDFPGAGGNYSGAALSSFVSNALATNEWDIADILLYRPTGAAVNLTDAQCRSIITLGIDAAIAAESSAPILTSPTGTSTGATTASGTVVTDTANGTLYFLATTNATELAATVKSTGGTQVVSASGTKTVAFTGLTPSTTYYPHYVHTNATAQDSTRVTGSSFTTSAAAATAVTLSGPSSGVVSVASTNFTVGANGTITGTVVVTPSDGGGGGTFSPTSVNISSGSPTATFTYTPSTVGSKTISVTNDGGLTNPSSITYTVSAAAATAITISGPSSGTENVASTNFTVGANGAITGTITVTPSVTGGGSFSPTTVNISSGSPYATFTYTPTTTGTKSISVANNGGLTNPSAVTYTSNAAGTFTATIGQLAVGGINLGAGTTVYWSLAPSGGGPGGTFTVTGSSAVDADGNIQVSHSVAGNACVLASTIPQATWNTNKPVFCQFVTLA